MVKLDTQLELEMGVDWNLVVGCLIFVNVFFNVGEEMFSRRINVKMKKSYFILSASKKSVCRRQY